LWNWIASHPPFARREELLGIKVDSPQQMETERLGNFHFQVMLMQLETVLYRRDLDQVRTAVAKQHSQKFAIVVAKTGEPEEIQRDVNLGACCVLANVRRRLVRGLLVSVLFGCLLGHQFVGVPWYCKDCDPPAAPGKGLVSRSRKVECLDRLDQLGGHLQLRPVTHIDSVGLEQAMEGEAEGVNGAAIG
jgi:hypothetical protein